MKQQTTVENSDSRFDSRQSSVKNFPEVGDSMTSSRYQIPKIDSLHSIKLNKKDGQESRDY